MDNLQEVLFITY